MPGSGTAYATQDYHIYCSLHISPQNSQCRQYTPTGMWLNILTSVFIYQQHGKLQACVVTRYHTHDRVITKCLYISNTGVYSRLHSNPVCQSNYHIWLFFFFYHSLSSLLQFLHVAVPGRNWTLFHYVFQLHNCIQSTVAQTLLLKEA